MSKFSRLALVSTTLSILVGCSLAPTQGISSHGAKVNPSVSPGIASYRQNKATFPWKPQPLLDRAILQEKASHFPKFRETQALIPPRIDNRQYCSPVADQGSLGSCTAFANGKGLREYLEIRHHEKYGQFTPMSPLFLYYEERSLDGTINIDSGAAVADGLEVLQTEGCAPEADWPYVISNFTIMPPTEAYQDALSWKIRMPEVLSSLTDIKEAVAQGAPVVIGFTFYDSSMYSTQVAQTGVMPMPAANDQPDGGHAVLVVGYDDNDQWLIVKNSWGPGWGDKGYFYMPYAFVTPDNVDQMYAVMD